MPDITGSWGRENDPIPYTEKDLEKFRIQNDKAKSLYDEKLEKFFMKNKIKKFELENLGLDLNLNGNSKYDYYIGYPTRTCFYVIANINPKDYEISFSYHADNIEVLNITLKLRDLLKERTIHYNTPNIKKEIQQLKSQKQEISNLIKKLA